MTAAPPRAAGTPLSGLDLGKGFPGHPQEAELLRQYVIVHLLQKVCSFFDHTPRTFFEHFLQMVRYGILSQDALSGSAPPLGLPVLRALGPPLLPGAAPWQPSAAPAEQVPVPEPLAMLRSESWDRALPALGRRVSRFEKDFLCVKRLGAGAFGEVWHCRHRIDGRDYAIKVVRFQGQGSETSPLRDRVLREVQCWSRLSHPNIARYNSAWVESDWASGGGWMLPIAEGDSGAPGPAAPAPAPARVGLRPNLHGQERVGIPTPKMPTPRSAGNLSTWTAHSDPSDGGFIWTVREEEEESEREAGDGNLVPCTESPAPCDLVSSLEQFRCEFTLYIQSELCRQDTLAEWLRQRDEDPEQRVREALEIFGQCLHALDHVHSHGCVHRDLKPSNVFFSTHGVVRLGDFGLAKDLLREAPQGGEDERRRGGSGVVGTLSYSSPEQLSASAGSEVGFETDIFSLGLMVAELFCPAGTQMERVKLFEQLRSGSEQADDILMSCPFVALRRTVRAMTGQDPRSRPSARHVIAQDLPELLGEVAAALGCEIVANLGGWDSSPTSSPVMAAEKSPALGPLPESACFGRLPSWGAPSPEALRVEKLGETILGAVGSMLGAKDQDEAFEALREAVAGGEAPPDTYEALQRRLEELPAGAQTFEQ